MAQADALRPELHRYCARLMGSVIEGEDVVQDTLVRALVALQDRESKELPSLRPWLFRIAHNRAIDLLRSRGVRQTEPIESALETPDPNSPDPLETLLQQEVLKTAVSRFVELPLPQRSAVILKDLLGESLADIASLLDLSVDAVKGHLARGRASLREANRGAMASPPVSAEPSAAVANYITLFHQRDWDSLRALLASDVKLKQSSYPLRVGPKDVGMFFSIYALCESIRLVPALLEGREAIVVYEDPHSETPSHLMWLEWRDGQIVYIRDYRYASYIVDDAELTLL
nr:sigma-70 family RNA polymerase sigma factor [Armatimonas rosea]